MLQGCFRALMALAALAMPGVAAAKVRALVVGVSHYERADLSDVALPGAASDAAAIAARLRGGDRDVTVLTGTAARADAITAALERLSAASQTGDRLVIYLAGHGVQAPARGTDEADGLDEWFLGADAGTWDARRRTLPGAVRDKAIGEAVDRARARGADVWLIVDACSGGGLSRGAAGTPRQLDPRRLGIGGIARGGVADSGGLVETGALPGGGRLVLFQAARPGGIAWERTLADESGNRERRGLFTWSLLRAWRSLDTTASFAELAAEAERERLAAGPPGGAALIAGDLSQPVLFAGAARDLLQVAQGTAPLPVAIRLGIGARGGRCPGPPPATLAPIDDRPIRVRGCRAVVVELTAGGAEERVVAWYRDAHGDMAALTGPMPRRVGAGEPLVFGFTITNRDPLTRAPLPSGREQLILLSEDGARGRVVPFDTGG